SYQGGHIEYFKYLKDLLREAGADYVKIFGGGGGVIVHSEKLELENYGITQIFHPDDGRRLGLEGMIEVILRACDFDLLSSVAPAPSVGKEFFDAPIPFRNLGLSLTALENKQSPSALEKSLQPFRRKGEAP